MKTRIFLVILFAALMAAPASSAGYNVSQPASGVAGITMYSVLEFCGQGGNAANRFLGPARAIGQELIKGNATCNGFDAATAAGADEIPWTDFGLNYTVTGMYCATDGGVNDTVDMTLYDDAASTNIACTITLGGGIADCSDDEVEQAAIAGASHMAVLVDPDEDDLSAVPFMCRVFIDF